MRTRPREARDAARFEERRMRTQRARMGERPSRRRDLPRLRLVGEWRRTMTLVSDATHYSDEIPKPTVSTRWMSSRTTRIAAAYRCRCQAAAAAELPAKFKERMDNPPPPKPHFDFGSIVHAHSRRRVRLRGAGAGGARAQKDGTVADSRPPRRHGRLPTPRLARWEDTDPRR